MAQFENHHVVMRPKMESHQAADPVQYESAIYQRGLHYERPPLTFQSLQWESQAEQRMSADARGYVVGNAGTGETARKNREAFAKWSIVPRRLVLTSGLPDLSTKVLGIDLPFPIAVAPVGVQRIFNPVSLSCCWSSQWN